jgi:hypothetical protein
MGAINIPLGMLIFLGVLVHSGVSEWSLDELS